MTTGGGSSILSPEKRIEVNPFDVDAWNLLLRESQARPIDQARSFYESLVTQFPSAGRYWKAYIDHELRSKNFENVENLFQRCLIHVLNIELWKSYVHYVREAKGHLPSFRETMAEAYNFALDKVGLDVNAYPIYSDYIAFLKAVPAAGQYAENQRITAVRKIYHQAISKPVTNVESLWAEYCNYEKSVNSTLAEKLISERGKDYAIAKKTLKNLEAVTRGLNRQAVSVPPRGSLTELKQLELWRRYIEWEKSNPLETEEYGQFAKRVVYAYEQALLCLGYYPEIWYEAAAFLQHAAKSLEEKGDVKQAQQMTTDAQQLYERAINGLMKEAPLIYYAYADFEEQRRKYDAVKKIYDKLLEIQNLDPTLTYIQLMKFARRTEGVRTARLVFKRARDDTRSRHHVFVAAALIEYYCSKDKDVAMRVFDLGLKKYGDEPDYACAYVEFLTHLNEDNNTRVVFERILTSGQMTGEKSSEIWDKYLEFETLVGDLTSTLKVDQRRRESQKDDTEDAQTNMIIDRYKFMNLMPCTIEQLKMMGYNKQFRAHSIGTPNGLISTTLSSNGASSSAQATGFQATSGQGQKVHGPQAASALMGGGKGGHLDIAGYPRPDTDQMIPFKPKAKTQFSYHPVPGGVYPPPPAVAHLMSQIPPPYSFIGPFVNVEKLMAVFAKYEPPKTKKDESSIENGTMLGPMRVEDIKKDLYQLVATTTDPNMAISATTSSYDGPSGSGGVVKRKRPGGGDSDSDEESGRGLSAKDIYKRRMGQRGE